MAGPRAACRNRTAAPPRAGARSWRARPPCGLTPRCVGPDGVLPSTPTPRHSVGALSGLGDLWPHRTYFPPLNVLGARASGQCPIHGHLHPKNSPISCTVTWCPCSPNSCLGGNGVVIVFTGGALSFSNCVKVLCSTLQHGV